MKIVDNKAVMQLVTIGLQNETHAQITEGLQQGERVIVYPSEEVQAGTKVRPLTRE